MTRLFLPTTVDEVFALWREHPQARLLAGGTDLLVHLRSAAPAPWPTLIGLERVTAWQGIRDEGATLALGSGTSFARIVVDPLLARHAPILPEAARSLGAPALRAMATLGGNLATASPAADSLPPLLALDASVELASATGCRVLPLARFLLGPGRTALAPHEVITRVLLPKPAAFTHWHYAKVGRRQSLAIAVASLAALLRRASDGRCLEIRLAWGSVAPTVLRLPAVESLLTGRRIDDALASRAAALAGASVAPIDDLRASAAYRRTLAGNLLLRFLSSLDG